MKGSYSSTTGACLGILLISALLFGEDTKLKPEDLVARHVESLGAPDAISSRQSNVVDGTSQVRFLVGGFGTQPGTALFFSKGNQYRLEMVFNNNQYRGENIVFDGRKFAVEFADTTNRSPLGEFLYTHNGLIKEGLLGSVLSTAWPLLSIKERQPRLQYGGLKKLDDREAHELEYRMRRGGGDVKIRLYFEPETYRHIKSVYTLKMSAPIGTSVSDVGQRETYYQLEETFGGFRSVEGLNLPGSWNIRFSIDGRMSLLWEWDIRVQKVTPNHPIG